LRKIWLVQRCAVNVDAAIGNRDPLTGQSDHPLYQQLRTATGIVDHDDIAAARSVEMLTQFFDHQTLIGVQVGLHALAVDARGLRQENVDQQCNNNGWYEGAAQVKQ
jgi:hypothetical protein